MAKEKMNPKNKKSLFLTLTIVFIILTFVMLNNALGNGVITFADVALSVNGMKSVKDGSLINSSSGSNQSGNKYPSGRDIYFFEKIDLGSRSDGYYYSVARMGGRFDDEEGEGEYVVLKKYGSYPEVDFFLLRMPEVPPANGYRISYTLAEEDFSDLIDDDFRNAYPEVFTGKTNDVFSVIDMDSDILMTFKELEQERSDRINEGIGNLFIYGFVSVLCVIGFIIAVPLGLSTIAWLLLAFIFLLLFIIFLCIFLTIKKEVSNGLSKSEKI